MICSTSRFSGKIPNEHSFLTVLLIFKIKTSDWCFTCKSLSTYFISLYSYPTLLCRCICYAADYWVSESTASAPYYDCTLFSAGLHELFQISDLNRSLYEFIFSCSQSSNSFLCRTPGRFFLSFMCVSIRLLAYMLLLVLKTSCLYNKIMWKLKFFF